MSAAFASPAYFQGHVLPGPRYAHPAAQAVAPPRAGRLAAFAAPGHAHFWAADATLLGAGQRDRAAQNRSVERDDHQSHIGDLSKDGELFYGKA